MSSYLANWHFIRVTPENWYAHAKELPEDRHKESPSSQRIFLPQHFRPRRWDGGMRCISFAGQSTCIVKK